MEEKFELVIWRVATIPGWEGGKELVGGERPTTSMAPPSPVAAEFDLTQIPSINIELPAGKEMVIPPPLAALLLPRVVAAMIPWTEERDERVSRPAGERLA